MKSNRIRIEITDKGKLLEIIEENYDNSLLPTVNIGRMLEKNCNIINNNIDNGCKVKIIVDRHTKQ